MSINPDIPLKLEPKEEVVGQYQTKTAPHQGAFLSDAGLLIVTSRRVLFYHRHSMIRKIIKRGAPQFELISSVPLNQVRKISTGGMIDKFIAINGKRYYMLGSETRAIGKVIKSAMKSMGTSAPEEVDNEPEEAEQVPPASAAPPPPVQTSRIKFCSYCGKENDADAKFCKSCGSEIGK